jgi:hypothetical protein
MHRLERLYHLAEAENLASILKHGLMSTERLLNFVRMSEPKRTALLRGHRRDCVRLSENVLIRDQRPRRRAALAGALQDGLVPADWYALFERPRLSLARPGPHGQATARLWPPATGSDHVRRRRIAREFRRQGVPVSHQ